MFECHSLLTIKYTDNEDPKTATADRKLMIWLTTISPFSKFFYRVTQLALSGKISLGHKVK